jgi:hypothetical protein
MLQMQGYNLFIQNALKYGFSLFGLPKTGQTWGPWEGYDGYYKKGYPLTGAHFTDNGNNTITDNATGLMWIKNPVLLGAGWVVSPTAPTKDFDTAIDDCIALNYAGYSDWRLPNVNEMNSIMNFGGSWPVIYTAFWPNLGGGSWWSSTSYMGWLGAAYIPDMDNGFSNFEFKSAKHYVLPVRGGA